MRRTSYLRLVLVLVSISAASAQLRITTSSVPTATQYQPYTTTLAATGGTAPYTWSVVTSTGVSLPEGMSLNPATGIVSAASVAGEGGYAVTIQVADSTSPTHATASATLDFGVNSDTSWAGCQMFPADSIYNQPAAQLPVDTTSAHQIPSAYLASPLHPDFGHGFYPDPAGIPWMRVPANQPSTNVNLATGGQIDPAGTYLWPYPQWPNAVVEGTADGTNGNDHHILILQTSVDNIAGPQTGPCTLYETYQSSAVPSMFNGATNTLSMLAGTHYVLNSDEIAASESTLDDGAQDSAGIPLVPLLLRYSEVPLNAQHPLRITFPSPTNWYFWPGTGCCTGSGPPQGLLYRLKASVNWQATCPVSTNPQAATLLQALQQYGAYMSDHGSSGFMQGVPDVRWNDDDLGCIKKFHVSDLEVVNNSMLEVSPTSGQTKPWIVPATLAAGAAGAAYSATLQAVGGTPTARHWALSGGSLPPGLQLNAATGAITGTIASSAGSAYSFNVTASDTASNLSSQSQGFSIAVSGGAPSVSVTVTTTPAGLLITVDGASYTAPQNFNWSAGAPHTLAVTSPQGAGTREVYSSWSDGGAQSHSIVVPSTATTYTASFTTEYLLTTKVTPSGGGTLGANPTSSDGYYNAATPVQLTAVPSSGHVFSAFSGDLTGAASPQTIVMSAPHSVTATFVVAPKFSVTLAHSSGFTRGESNATYTVTVKNTAATATSGTVSLSETLPPGMTLVSMAGTGWTCTSGSKTCTRNDSLAGNSSYPTVTVTVDISTTAGSPLTNTVTVSGGGAATVTTSDSVTVKR